MQVMYTVDILLRVAIDVCHIVYIHVHVHVCSADSRSLCILLIALHILGLLTIIKIGVYRVKLCINGYCCVCVCVCYCIDFESPGMIVSIEGIATIVPWSVPVTQCP